MKLILSNNTAAKFVDFYDGLARKHPGLLEYANYTSLLFLMDTGVSAAGRLRAVNLDNGRELAGYDGVYINGYLNTYELAAATAIVCDTTGVPFANRELSDPPSLSKLTSYAKLAAAGVRMPRTIAGTKAALSRAGAHMDGGLFPAILKRADADRGIDNFKVADAAEVRELLAEHDQRSLWILQEYIDNDGFYLASYYGGEATFCIFRSLEARPDGNARKAHMYKPKGGSNARLIPLDEVPAAILRECGLALQTMNRQIGSVDCLYDAATDTAYVLEVNYNPQLVTIETFKEVRVDAFVDYLSRDWPLPDSGK